MARKKIFLDEKKILILLNVVYKIYNFNKIFKFLNLIQNNIYNSNLLIFNKNMKKEEM